MSIGVFLVRLPRLHICESCWQDKFHGCHVLPNVCILVVPVIFVQSSLNATTRAPSNRPMQCSSSFPICLRVVYVLEIKFTGSTSELSSLQCSFRFKLGRIWSQTIEELKLRSHLQVKMSQVTTRAQARAQEMKGQPEPEVDQYELDRRAASGETVVKGGEGGLSLEAQQHLAAGRKTGGITRKHQITHEGYHDLGVKSHPPNSGAAASSDVAK